MIKSFLLEQKVSVSILLCLSLKLFAETAIKVPSFNTCCGKDDRYFANFYKRYDHTLNNTHLGKLLHGLYKKNPVPTTINTNVPDRIPRIVHQIWIGSPLPEKFKKWTKTWQSMPGWTYKLWTDTEIAELTLTNREIYDASRNYGQKSDILRIELLNQFGGLYADIDFECLNANFFNLLNKHYDFYTGIEPLDTGGVKVNNALIGSIPDHPILKAYIRALKSRCKQPICSFKENIVYMTGPGYFTEIFATYAGKKYKDIALPPTFFYPLGADQPRYFNFPGHTKLKELVAKQESAAIHWWAGSWRSIPTDDKQSTLD
jgi:mannosyltransferase OCH1-like enzyme